MKTIPVNWREPGSPNFIEDVDCRMKIVDCRLSIVDCRFFPSQVPNKNCRILLKLSIFFSKRKLSIVDCRFLLKLPIKSKPRAATRFWQSSMSAHHDVCSYLIFGFQMHC